MPEIQHTRLSAKPAFRPWRFLIVFLAVFFAFATFLFIIDFVPEAPGSSTGKANDVLPATSGIARAQNYPIENPVRIAAPAVGIDTQISNPSSVNADALNNALLNGAVRYPQSGLLGENSRMYIFGHQSYLPIVHNQAFKAFNGLQKLKTGDEIIVYGTNAAYEYRVSSVRHVTADNGQVGLGSGDRTLTLTTCDSFGTKEDRYEVEAQFIGPLSAS